MSDNGGPTHEPEGLPGHDECKRSPRFHGLPQIGHTRQSYKGTTSVVSAAMEPLTSKVKQALSLDRTEA